MTSVVERDAFRHYEDDDDGSVQCPLALNGRGPFKGHCRACDNRLRPPRPYPIRDANNNVIVCDWVDPYA